ncbi:pilus assembly PilX family protein [Halopseudomonas bauzanensis]|uniref:pilus assembly PilX family protein n=1 Tax=Halopseudomonas bauzanensis TaxID=653930 RepID=UPI0025541187|nr:hypothetical protein [Halopseudomonas bauzanensis]
MKRNSGARAYASQRGAALLVALIILVMVSVMGISALRSSMFSGKVATGIQADAMTFEAAETALGVTYRHLSTMTDQALYTALDGGAVEFCVENANPDATGACGANTFMDDRQLLRARSVSYHAGYSPIDGSQVSLTGTGSVFVDYQVNMLAESDMPSLSLENYHLQEALKRGIMPASDIK